MKNKGARRFVQRSKIKTADAVTQHGDAFDAQSATIFARSARIFEQAIRVNRERVAVLKNFDWRVTTVAVDHNHLAVAILVRAATPAHPFKVKMGIELPRLRVSAAKEKTARTPTLRRWHPVGNGG